MAALPLHDPVHIFALVMLVILVVPTLCRLARVPSSFGLILIGIVLGPHGLALLERDATMRLLGTVGLLYIMFQAGLEIDLQEFLRHRGNSLVFGFLTFIFPMALGIAAALLLLDLGVLPAVLLGSLFASHTLLTFPTVSRLGLARTPLVATVVGGTMLTDTAAFVVLAAVAALSRGDSSLGFWVRFLVSASLASVLALWGLSRLGRWFLRHAATDDTVEYVFALTAVFASAVLLQVAGLEPIIGAFLAGLALNRLVPENSILMNRIRFVGNALFIPFFLITVGMLVNPRLPFESHDAARVALVMSGVALLSKAMAAGLTRRLLGYDRDEGGLMYGLSVNQAAATLAAVMVGFELGLFSEAVVTGTVLMILVTCFAGAWVTDLFAGRLARRQVRRSFEGSAPCDRIMVPLANPATAGALIELALLLRRPGSQEPLYPAAVVPEGPHGMLRAVAEAENMLGGVVVHAVAAGVPVFPVTRVDTNVATGLCRAMTDFRAATAVMGWNGEVSSLQRVFGRVLDQLLDQSLQMLMVYRAAGPLRAVQRLIVLEPPLVDRHPGMAVVKQCLVGLSQQLGAGLHRLCLADAVASWPAAAAGAGVRVLPSWSAALSTLAELAPGPGDAVVVLAVRRGALGWQPALDRLPRQAAGRFADVNLIIAYPPEGDQAASPAAAPAAAAAAAPLVRPEDVRVDLDRTELDGAVEALLEIALAGEPQALAQVLRQCRDAAVPAPLELVPGVVLVHLHVRAAAALAESRVLLGLNPRGFAVRGSDSPASCLFLLLSPADQPVEVHLRKLAAIAGCLRDPARRRGLLEAPDAVAAAAALAAPAAP